MRRLMLLRHARSGRPAGVVDFDRPLAEGGREAARRMGRYLGEERLLADLALVSPSRRTRETWDLVEPHLGAAPVRFDDRIYEARAERLLSIIREIEAENRTVLMLGHNPGFEDAARRLVGGGDPEEVARLAAKFPAAAVAVIDFAAESWAGAKPRTGRLDRFVTPKSLGLAEDD